MMKKYDFLIQCAMGTVSAFIISTFHNRRVDVAVAAVVQRARASKRKASMIIYVVQELCLKYGNYQTACECWFLWSWGLQLQQVAMSLYQV